MGEGREIPGDWSYASMSVGVQSWEGLSVGIISEFRVSKSGVIYSASLVLGLTYD